MPLLSLKLKQENIRQNVVNAWQNSGLLEGLTRPATPNLALLLESQASQLLYDPEPENVYTRIVIFEKYQPYRTSKKSTFEGLELPLIRRVFAQTAALDLVSVQPMAQPTGMLFYLDYQYEPENLYNRVVLVEKYKSYTHSFPRPTYSELRNER